nr:long-chain-fatty-acid--CoA ligase-like [Nerophis lumbriciformis]
MATRLHDLIHVSAQADPDAGALTVKKQHLSYGQLASETLKIASGLSAMGVRKFDRVAVFLEKRFETVVAFFSVSNAGAVLVPVNPVLKAAQVGHILRDCEATVLITSIARLSALTQELTHCPSLDHVVLVDEAAPDSTDDSIKRWQELQAGSARPLPRVIDTDLAAILYTSGSTGQPKGVMLSHRNMVAGAQSVAQYLNNTSTDCILSALPLSFDAGFSQLTTAFSVGARVVLLNYLMPRDVIGSMDQEGVTGLTAVPPLWIQLGQLQWPESVVESLRYFANTGGHMPAQTLARLREALPRSKPFLMYGLTEAFRATYLPPEQVDAKPDSMGKSIPNSEVFVLREDGTCCDADEPGELVQRGALVGMGYWNDPEKTAARYRPLPDHLRPPGVVTPELAVYSGDVVRL